MSTIDELFEELDKKPETLREIIREYKYDIVHYYKTYILGPFLKIKNYIRNLIRYSPILWRDYDWDYDFFLNIQDKKLSFMEKYHNNSQICMENSWIASRIKMARSLLYIARSLDSDKHEECFWTPYVNIKNANRFCDKWDYLLKSNKDNKKKQRALYDLRKKKAWYLYHKLLFLYTQGWWD